MCLGHQSTVNIGAVSNRVTHAIQYTVAQEKQPFLAYSHDNTEEPSRVKKCCNFAAGGTMTRTLYIRRPSMARTAKQSTCEIESLVYITGGEGTADLQRFDRFHSGGASLWR